MTRRIRLIIEYDGSNYAGWQRQLNAMSVQARLEEAIFSLTCENVSVTGASRTDAGVSACRQAAHFDTASRVPGDKFSYALNALLPPDIRVRESRVASADFHARHHAKAKLYRYLIYVSPHAPAIGRRIMAHVAYPLDETLMAREARAMPGAHDFKAFAAAGSCAKNTVRTVLRTDVLKRRDVIAVNIMGDGFLYNMVRIYAGALIGVGSGKLNPGAISRAINSKDRLDLGVTAPASGLTLMRVFYDGDDMDEAYSMVVDDFGIEIQ
jgi:tRNA pseudouridine38-40 synthase